MTAEGRAHHLVWTLPAAEEPEAEPDPLGFQVWRGGHGWALLATISGEAHRFLDERPGDDARYKVTMFSDYAEEAGYIGPGTDPSQVAWWRPDLYKTAETTATVLPVIPLWVPAGWAALGAVSALLVLGMVRGARRLDLRIAERRTVRPLDPRVDGVAIREVLRAMPSEPTIQPQDMEAFGIRSSRALQQADPDALGFWLGVPREEVRRWQGTSHLLHSGLFEPRVGLALIQAGVRTLDDLSHAEADDLLERMVRGTAEDGTTRRVVETLRQGTVDGWIQQARLSAEGRPPAEPAHET